LTSSPPELTHLLDFDFCVVVFLKNLLPKQYKREIRLMNVLQFVSTQVWKALFGKNADSLERSIDNANEFMIVDYDPLTSTFVSVPADLGQLSADAYISGIVAGVLNGAGFMAQVTAHSVTMEEGEHTTPPSWSSGSLMPLRKEKAVFLVKFAPEVLERDAAMDR
jgi:trafficking protein particle complex subunit 5